MAIREETKIKVQKKLIKQIQKDVEESNYRAKEAFQKAMDAEAEVKRIEEQLKIAVRKLKEAKEKSGQKGSHQKNCTEKS